MQASAWAIGFRQKASISRRSTASSKPWCPDWSALKKGGFKPALIDAGKGQREIVHRVEDIGDGECTARFPHAPTGFAGQVKIVAYDRIAPLKAGLGDVRLVMNHMGLGPAQTA